MLRCGIFLETCKRVWVEPSSLVPLYCAPSLSPPFFLGVFNSAVLFLRLGPRLSNPWPRPTTYFVNIQARGVAPTTLLFVFRKLPCIFCEIKNQRTELFLHEGVGFFFASSINFRQNPLTKELTHNNLIFRSIDQEKKNKVSTSP